MSSSRSSNTYAYYRPPAGTASRSPCPALNALANHGYIRRSGTDLTFGEVMRAVRTVYHLSFPLAFLLAFGGFVTCGTLSWSHPWDCRSPTQTRTSSSGTVNENNKPARRQSSFVLEARPTNALLQGLAWLSQRVLSVVPVPTLTLNLAALSARGAAHIAHDASLVHPNGVPSTTPCAALLDRLMVFVKKVHEHDVALISKAVDAHNSLHVALGGIDHRLDTPTGMGLGLEELAAYHAQRMMLSPAMNALHTEIAGAECALVWEVFSTAAPTAIAEGDTAGQKPQRIVPATWLKQWLGEERLPDGWSRPTEEIELFRTKRLAGQIERYKAE